MHYKAPHFYPSTFLLSTHFSLCIHNWDAFVEELRHNFGPFDEQGDAKTELMNLYMKDSQRVSDYLV